MKCALWLNRQKVYSADEIARYPDIASLRGYFLAGSLVEWLKGHGGAHYAEKLESLQRDDPELNEKLAAIFGGSPEDGRRFGESSCPPVLTNVGSVFTFGSMPGGSFALLSSYGSFTLSRREFTTSFSLGSGVFGSGIGIHEWEWEWLFRTYRSFTSYVSTSFGGFGRARFFNIIKLGSFGSFSFGSFWSMGNFGSFPQSVNIDLDSLDEYDRIMLETLMMCPLDRFGYGIHNI